MHAYVRARACVCVRARVCARAHVCACNARVCDMEVLPLLEILFLQVLNMLLLLLHCTLLPMLTPCSNDWLPED